MKLKINPVFRDLIPKLSADELKQLEENLVTEGCRDALIIWNGTIIDGHNRYEICTRHNIPFVTEDIDLASEDDAKIWIIKNQIGRRNLDLIDRNILGDALKPLIAAKARENQTMVLKQGPVFPVLDKREKSVNTLEEVSTAIGVGHSTRGKYERVMKKAPEEIKQKMLDKEMTINGAYTKAFPEPRKYDTSGKDFAPEALLTEPPQKTEPVTDFTEEQTEYLGYVNDFFIDMSRFEIMPRAFVGITQDSEIYKATEKIIKRMNKIMTHMGGN